MPTRLAELLDGLTDTGGAGVVETGHAITVAGLDERNTAAIYEQVCALGWTIRVEDDSGEPVDLDNLALGLAPYRATIEKPQREASRLVVTAVGLVQALREPSSAGIWELARCASRFDTGTISFNPWGAAGAFSPTGELKSPLSVVREANEERVVPKDIRKWLLRSEEVTRLWGEPRFRTFVQIAAPNLIRALGSEVRGHTDVVFIGPPRRSPEFDEATLGDSLGPAGFESLRSAAAWVYEDPVSTEQRHALYAAEFARSVSTGASLSKAITASGKDILQGARLAYQLSLSDLGKDALKAQADLRKAVADDTSKSAEGARSVATALAASIATGIGLVVARANSSVEPIILTVITAVVALYLCIIAFSGLHHLRVQRLLQAEWRTRFYRFIPDDDYAKMVTDPVKSAEVPYRVLAWVCILAAVVLAVLALSSWQPLAEVFSAAKAHFAAEPNGGSVVPLPNSSGAAIAPNCQQHLQRAPCGSGAPLPPASDAP